MFTPLKYIYAIQTIVHTSVLKNFFIYVFGALCLGGFTLLLAPLNMRMLSPEEYGMLSLITSCMAIGVTILGLGLRQFLSIEYFHHDTHGQKKLINHILIIYIALAIPLCASIFIFKSYILNLLSLHSISPAAFLIALFTIFFSFFAELFYQVLKYQQRASLLTLVQTSIALASLALTITLLIYLELGIISTLIGQLASMFTATCIGFYVYRKENISEHLHLEQSKEVAFHYLKNALPFIPAILFGWIISSSDRFVLAHYASMRDVGIYAIADMAGQAFRLLILQSWSGSYLPYILEQYQRNKNNLLAIEQMNQKIMWAVLAVLSIILLLGFVITKPFLLVLIPPTYQESIHYILIILAGHIFLLGSYFAASFIQFHKKIYFLTAAFCIPAILNLIFNLLLVQRYKIYGCTVATLCAYGIYFFIILWYNSRLIKSIDVTGNKHGNPLQINK